MITLTLPYPISANRYWRTYLPRGCASPVTTVSSEARAYQADVRKRATAAGITSPVSGRVAVSYVLYPKRPQDWRSRFKKNPCNWDDNVQCIDLDNAQKVLFDAMEGVVFEDDKWIRRIEAERAQPDGEARVVIKIVQLDRGMSENEVTKVEPQWTSFRNFPIGSCVMTPSGKKAIVRRYLNGSSKHDHFDRLICRYVDGGRESGWVTLQPRLLKRVE